MDTLVDSRTGTIAFRTMALTAGQALRGERGDNAVITGELLPPGAPAWVAAVVLMHGAGSVQNYHCQWARALRSIGFATFIVDNWGRGVTVGYDPQAYADALGTVKAFLTTTVAAGR